MAHAPCHVVDILPMILEATGTTYPAELGGHAIQALDGESLLPLLEGHRWARGQPIFWEHEGNCAVRAGNLKLVRRFNQPWELYDMQADRTELNNLAGRYVQQVALMDKSYGQWAESAGVVDWNLMLPKLLSLWQMDDVNG